MRLTRTFVLRLYTDRAVRERICGDLQALPGRRTHPFRDGTQLLGLLDRIANDEAGRAVDVGTAPHPGDPDPPEPDRMTSERP